MNVTGLGTIGIKGNADDTAQKNVMGKDDFLLLLTAQLKNQDPLSPLDPTEFTAQLAQFSSLEQLMGINDNLESLQLFSLASNNAAYANLIGKTITASGGGVSVQGGLVSNALSFDLESEAASVFVDIYDESGALVRSIMVGQHDAGSHTMDWDGKNDSGNPVSDGNYVYQVRAVDGDLNMVRAQAQTTGVVDGISYQNGAAMLMIGSLEIPVGMIIRVEAAGN